MGERLSQGNLGIALLANSVATGLGLFVLIVVFAPLSGAEFNPLVTVLNTVQRGSSVKLAAFTVVCQVIGALAGVAIAHAIFGLPAFTESKHVRDGLPMDLAEAIATFGLFLTILGVRFRGAVTTAACVGAYVAAAYWFTSSTSFANPAVTVARSLTTTFSGIAPSSVPGFVFSQCIGAGAAYLFGKMMGFASESPSEKEP
jgi:glycerol uptake facilitator-like aquaporin